MSEPEKEKPKKKKPQTLKESVAAPPPRPTLDGFLDHFFALAGGQEAVAKMVFQEYTAAKSGSLLRSRVLEMVLRQLKTADASGRQTDELGLLSDDDIERLLVEREARLLSDIEQANASRSEQPRPAGPAPAQEAGPQGVDPAAGPVKDPPAA